MSKKIFRPAKTDANQAEIVAALRAHGCETLSLAPMGNGCPDLLVWTPHGLYASDIGMAPARLAEARACSARYSGEHLLMEIKDGAKPPSARKLTPKQRAFHEWWPGEIHIVETVDQALAAAGVIET
jgi:hypothetical protein